MNRRTLLKAIPAALASAAGGKAQEMSKGKKSGVKAKAMDDKKKDRHALAALLICLKSDSNKNFSQRDLLRDNQTAPAGDGQLAKLDKEVYTGFHARLNIGQDLATALDNVHKEIKAAGDGRYGDNECPYFDTLDPVINRLLRA